MTEIRLLRLPAVLERRARGRAAHYNDVKKGEFPPPVHLNPRVAVWPSHEVDEVLRAQIAGVTNDDLKSLVKRLVAQRSPATAAA